jgi:aerobic carbon-monoxide dehydrogenase large subunit
VSSEPIESVRRPEGFVRGTGRFVDDLEFADLLYLGVVRSPWGRARIVGIHGAPITAATFPARLEAEGEGASGPAIGVSEPALATGEVHYVGEPVAAVLASSGARAEDLVASVGVDYEPGTPVLEPEAALAAPPMHPTLASNVMSEHRLGAEFTLPAGAVTVEERYRMPRVAANPIEPRGIVVRYDHGSLTAYASTQSVHSLRDGLAGALGLLPERVRVVQADTGGGFGVKGSVDPEFAIAAFAAMRTGRPVKWIETRSEHLAASRAGRGSVARVALSATRDGRLLGLDADVLVDAGAYFAGLNGFASRFIGLQLTGPYAIPAARVHARSIYTNKAPLGPYRGAGRPEAAFFLERTIDRLADELGIDPLELRRRNLTDAPATSPLGLSIGAGRPFFERAIAEFAAAPPPPGGTGICFFVLVPAAMPGEGARLRVVDGELRVGLGSMDHGQGHAPWIRDLLSGALGVDASRIVVERGDTAELAEGVGTWGSRSAMVGGNALLAVARALREEVEREGAPYSAERLLARTRDVSRFVPVEERLNSFGANRVTVTVDALGQVTVREVVSVYDLGHVLVRGNVESQIFGGAVQGIGHTLSEEIAYGPEGALRTGTIADAGLPGADVAPTFRTVLVEDPSPLPHGAKGLGESPTIGVPPALARAIEVATGHRIARTPIRPEDLGRDGAREAR